MGLLISLAWCITTTLVVYLRPDLCEGLNHRLYNMKIALATPPEHTDQIVHVDVDDKAVQKYGRWPWDRSFSAKIVKRLSELGARAIVFDVLYTVHNEQTAAGDEVFVAAVKRADNVVPGTGLALTDDYKKKLDYKEAPHRASALHDKAWEIPVPDGIALKRVEKLKRSWLPFLELIESSREVGHIKGTRDSDGVYRRLPLMVSFEGRVLPCLSLAALSAAWDLKRDDIAKTFSLDPSGRLIIRHDSQTFRVPVTSEGELLVNWGTMWKSFDRLSVTDVLSDDPDDTRRSRYEGKIVFVAVTTTGSTDFAVSPVERDTPMSRIHSHALSTILTENYIFPVPPFPYSVIPAAIVALLFALAASKLRWKIGVAVGAVVGALSFVALVLFFTIARYDVPMTEYFLVFLPAASFAMVTRAVLIEMQAARASRALERYLAPELLEDILESGEELDISAKRRELTILFVDIQGFSSISEQVDVEYVHQVLNDFYERMTRAVFDHNGTIDKFLGDGVLAFFGDPIPLENTAQAAVGAAVQMQQEIRKLNERWTQAGIPMLESGIKIRIGINTGQVVVGNLGSARRLEYTVVGSAVNIASRLQTIGPAGGIMMSERTRSLLNDALQYDGPDSARVKGIERDLIVYRILPESIPSPHGETNSIDEGSQNDRGVKGAA